MTFLKNLFNLIWSGLSAFWTFLSSAAGIFGACLIGIVTSFVTLLSSLINEGGQLYTYLTTLTTPIVTEVSTFLQQQSSDSGLFSFLAYSLGLDVLVECLYMLSTFVFLVVATFCTFWMVAVPAWFIGWFALRATVWLMVLLFPSSWLPAGFSSLGSIKMSQ